MPRVLIIGLGNSLRRDDRVGEEVVRRIEAHYRDSSDVEAFHCHQPTPELSEQMSRFETVVFVDAGIGRDAGVVNCQQLSPAASGRTSSHILTPAQLLALTHQLYGKKPLSYGVTIGGQSFDLGENMTPVVAAAVDTAVDVVRGLVTDRATAALSEGPTSALDC
ncbi:MAG: hydrogenase maturation protease [candidate division Zixibacteria bacterium]|nr:hydrogenase maturation protease [candidate division Zixibacteria bacterium]